MPDKVTSINENEELRKQNKQLREALEALYSVQNGPPLIQYAGLWEEAMESASQALKDNPPWHEV